MANKNRLEKLEKARSAGTVNKYLCVISNLHGKQEADFKVQPCNGTGGEPFYFATRAELDAFGARPGVDLDIVIVGYVKASEAIEDRAQ